MAGLKRLVGVTLAVILVTALVVYVLRPSATTTTSVVNEPGTPTVQPPGDLGTCRDQPHGLYPAACHPSSGTGSGSGSGNGTGNDTDDDHETGDHHSDHEDNDNDHHGHEWGESGDHDDDHDENHGDHHSDHDHGDSEHNDP